jgi:hypothetical protein
MIHGLLWFPLLFFFVGIAIAGKNEYQKVEAYKLWAAEFDRAKFDIKAALGQKGMDLTWGRFDRKAGLQDPKTLSLNTVKEIRLVVDGETVDPLNPPNKGKQIQLELVAKEGGVEAIAFTEVPLAVRWGQALVKDLQKLALG